MASGRRQAGTNIRRELDVTKVGASLRQPGIDPRAWVEYGTVASVGSADGTPDFQNGNAIVIAPDGIYVDVVLGTDEYPTPCRYGHQHGAVFLLMPIRPGDLVEVTIPGGDMAAGPSISKVLGGPHTPIPVDDNGLPRFKNDRAFLYGDGVPVEIRTSGGGVVIVNPDGTVILGRDDAAEQFVLGTTYRQKQQVLDNAMIAAMQAAATVCHAATNPGTTMAGVQAVATMLDAIVSALQQFEQGTYLSDIVKGK